MTRSVTYEQAYRAGVKDVVERLYKFADEMNDPHARLVIHLAADTIGKDFKHDRSAR